MLKNYSVSEVVSNPAARGIPNSRKRRERELCLHQSAVTVVFHSMHCCFRLMGVCLITERVTHLSRSIKSDSLRAKHSTFGEVTFHLLQAAVEGCRVLETLTS